MISKNLRLKSQARISAVALQLTIESHSDDRHPSVGIYSNATNNIIIPLRNFKMPNTYVKLYVQTVFSVKYRNALIKEHFRKELHAVVGNLINETGCKTIIVNGVDDHIHCFFSLKSSISLSEVMKSVKAKSSKWVNESGFLEERFEWQRGFGGFSYSQSAISNVYKYIENQE